MHLTSFEMKKNVFNKGILYAGFGSFWWGFFGVIYFKYIAYIGHIELVVHRCNWFTEKAISLYLELRALSENSVGLLICTARVGSRPGFSPR